MMSPCFTILLVDDRKIERVLIRAMLERFSHQVIEAENGTQALALLASPQCNIDIILLDVEMPYMGGLEVARRIRDSEREQNIEWRPIIFISGHNTPNDIFNGIDAGGDGFLSKPVDSLVLLAKVKAMGRIAQMRSRLIETQAKLIEQAHFDELTGIANRRHFFALLEKEMARCTRHDLTMCLAYFDIDHFKNINDTYGHDTGDKVIRHITNVVEKRSRSTDILGRIGGEEFCLVLPETDLVKATEKLDMLRQEIISSQDDARYAIPKAVTVSFGVTAFKANDSMIELIARADRFLLDAKRKGRNKVVSGY